MSLLKSLLLSSSPPSIETDAYRKRHSIDGTTVDAPDPQTDYQVKVKVHYASGVDSGEDVYLGGKCEDDFVNVRFTKSDGITPLDYYLGPIWELWGEKIVDADGMDGYATYATAGSGAIHYVGTHNRTYIVYQDQAFDPNILYYDHDTGTFSAAVQIANSPIADAHGAPALLIDEDGYLHVFYGAHNSALKHAKSDNPEDISAWTVQANVIGFATYPCSRIASNGDIYVFYRGPTEAKRSFRKSTDNGASWEAEVTYVDFGAGSVPFRRQVLIGSDDSIHVIWCWYLAATLTRYNIYYAYSTDGGSTWTAKDGTDLGAVISKAEADANCLVYDSTGDPAQPTNGNFITGEDLDVRLDEDNEPYILFIHGKAGNECQLAFARWNSIAIDWDIFNITTTKKPAIGSIIDYVSSTDVRAYLTVTAGDANLYGNLEFWKSVDNGENWSKIRTIASEENVLSASPKLVINYLDDLQLVWSVGSAIPSDVYAYGDAMTPELYAIFWVEVDTIPADPDSVVIYIYYGKAGEATASDGPATFIFFDDFGDNDISDWTIIGDAGSVSVAGGIVIVADPAAETHVYKSIANLTGFKMSGKIRSDKQSYVDLKITLDAIATVAIVVGYGEVNTGEAIGWHDGGAWQIAQAASYGMFHTIEIMVVDTSVDDMDLIIDDEPKVDADLLAVRASINIIALDVGAANDPTGELDVIWVGKYVDPEPAHGAWDAEEPVVWPF